MPEQSNSNGGGGYWLETLRRQRGEQIRTRVVGVTFAGRQRAVAQLKVGEALRLRREPDNPHDPNAVRVERLTGAQVGYLNRELAARIKSCAGLSARVRRLLGSGQRLGVEIEFDMSKLKKGGDDIEGFPMDG
jgi:hypothetical protein